MDAILDRRESCLSIMLTLTYPQYKNIIEEVYRNRGGIEGQRDVLKASTAIRIRKRMIEDICKGTILPPVVIGAVIDEGPLSSFEHLQEDQLITWLQENLDSISLIDGMQRTTALLAAEKEYSASLADYKLRVEIWFSKSVNHLIYRMLILNSGQVPWDIKRQLQTVFGSVLKKIKADNPLISIYTQDESKRRSAPAQYQASDILELYLVFGSRKEKIDIKERLSDEFVRLDFIDITSTDESISLFGTALGLMAKADIAFSRHDEVINSTNDEHRFNQGKDIFASQPARVGFVAALSILMMGRPGNTLAKEQLLCRWQEKEEKFSNLLEQFDNMSPAQLEAFLALQTLSDKLSSKKVQKVGDYEREFFKVAFTTLLEEADGITSLEICWNAY